MRMKSINFSGQELDILRTHYQHELVEAEKYVKEIKNLLSKLGIKPATTASVPEKKSRRGRKKAEAPKESQLKAGKRGRKQKAKIIEEKVQAEVISTKTASVPLSIGPKDKTVKKTKVKRSKKDFKRRGVILTPLSKPLKKKVDGLPVEAIPERSA